LLPSMFLSLIWISIYNAVYHSYSTAYSTKVASEKSDLVMLVFAFFVFLLVLFYIIYDTL